LRRQCVVELSLDPSAVKVMSELEESNKSRLGLVILLVTVLVGIGAVGAVGYISGAGWFGYRQIMYGDGQVYLLNMGAQTLEVSVEDREPVEVPPEDARVVDVVGGESKIVVRDEDGQVVDRHNLFVDNSHALLKLSDDGCLVASDVGAFYGRGGEALEFVEMIEQDQRLYVPGTTNVVWPRQDFPARFDRDGGDAIWIELVGCTLLGQPEFLEAYLDVRLSNRLKKGKQKQR
jgi:hypothetical protein